MNRNIELFERINNPSLHYPQRSDLSSSDAVFQASDYVIIIHRPEILGILSYGYTNLSVKNMIFLHILKTMEKLEFESIKSASEALKIDRTSISKALHKVIKSAGNYYWELAVKAA